ncbi:LysE family transporter [Desulfitobacterium metallireducens]|uniref:Lysine transporter LysE n=1 Tax=Desulfitobacterium metallireducens DSM 15288 TaxID=871968 RepID=W0EE20_9FIRM|nr:LysE family transporter [Desulfitobacterium metallireducens]AHF07311.1 lysine transporter LysE [Desulfitobacterium metallireducens DSM 15288]
MELGSIFVASLVMGFSGAIMPGPVLTVTINETLRRGFKAGPLIILGHAFLELLLVLLLLFGFGTVLNIPLVQGLIGLIGGLFLIWMAYGMIREAREKDLDMSLNASQSEKSMNPVLLGVTTSSSNPYWVLWWATVGMGSLMLAGKNGIGGSVCFYLGHIASDFIWFSLVSGAVAKGRRLLTPMVYRTILWVCGLFLMGIATYFIYSGIRFL